MAKKIVAIFSVTRATLALRELSLSLRDQVPAGSDWRALVRPTHALEARVTQLAGRVIQLAVAIKELHCRGVRLRIAPGDDPAALSRLDLQILPSRLRKQPGTTKALKKVLALMRLLAGAGWWGVNAVSGGVHSWSLHTVVADIVALAAGFQVEVAPITFASKVDPTPSSMPGSRQVSDKPSSTRPKRASDRASQASAKTSATKTSAAKPAPAKPAPAKPAPAKTSTSAKKAAPSAHTTPPPPPAAAPARDRSQAPAPKARAEAPPKARGEAPPRARTRAPDEPGAGKKAGKKKAKTSAGSFGGLPDDEASAPAASRGGELSEEATLFLSYGRLTWPCSEGELRAVHRQIVKTLHPDRHPGDAAAGHRFMWLQRGYEALRARLASADAPGQAVQASE